MTSQKRREVAVPLIHEIQPALLHPSVEVVLRDLVGEVKDAIVRSQNLYRSLFHRNPCSAELRGIRREFPFVEIGDASVVLRDQGPAVVDEIQQLFIVGREILLSIVGADSQNNRLVLAQVFAGEFLRRNHGNLHSNLLQAQ